MDPFDRVMLAAILTGPTLFGLAWILGTFSVMASVHVYFGGI